MTSLIYVCTIATILGAEPARVPDAILDLALEPPVINTAPGPEYTSAQLDYAMVIGADRTRGGRIWAAWVAGGDSDKGLFVCNTSDDGGETWSEPRLVIDPPDVPDGLRRRNLVGNFWTDPTGKLWLFFDQSMGYFDGRAGSWAITCDDPDADVPQWSAPRRIWHGMTLNKPLVLKNGDWLMPISLWTRDRIRPAPLGPEFPELDEFRMAHLFVSQDQGATWMRRGGVVVPQSDFDEHMFVELKDGRLWMLARTKYGIAETYSSDGGATWSEPQPSAIQNVSSRFFLRRLASGNLLLVKNGPLGERLKKRSHLTAYLSDDDGRSWRGGLVIDERDGVSYPDGFQAPDGVIHIVHDHERAREREILMARFTETDVLAGKFIEPGSRGKMLVHKARGGANSQAKVEPFGAYPSAQPDAVNGKHYDLVVVGGTAGGVACAVRAAREGLGVLLVNHTKHLGGFMTSGAGGWEAPYDGLRSPIYGELRTQAAAYYAKTYGEGSPQHTASLPSAKTNAHIDRPKIEPRVCEMLLNRLAAAEPPLTVLTNFNVTDVDRDGARLRGATFREMHGDKTVTVSAAMWADGMYEADLVAAAKVPYRVGREARTEYDEPHAGVLYVKERAKAKGQLGFPLDAAEGRLKIRYNSHATGEILPQSTGEADESVMAYNYRLILSRDPANRVMVAKPADYDAAIAKAAASGGFVPNLPNGKVAWNGGRLIGPQNDYPEADWPTREAISRRYLDAMIMRLWYLQNDPNVSQRDRKMFAGYGLARDEFPDNGNKPYEIYVREARRLVGRYVFREQDNVVAAGTSRTPIHADGIAMTDWPVDSVACLPRTVPGGKQDGIFFLGEESRPAQVPYRSLLAQEVDNLLVPVALSASHVGWGAIRLEPVWVQTGEAAGLAAALAKRHDTTLAALDADLLVRALCDRGATVSFFNDVDAAADPARSAPLQYFGTKGFFASYDARPDEPLSPELAEVWLDGFAQLTAGKLDAQALARRVAPLEKAPSSGTTTVAEFAGRLQSKNAPIDDKHDDARSPGKAGGKRDPGAAAHPAFPGLGGADEPLTRVEACRILYSLVKQGAKS